MIAYSFPTLVIVNSRNNARYWFIKTKYTTAIDTITKSRISKISMVIISCYANLTASSDIGSTGTFEHTIYIDPEGSAFFFHSYHMPFLVIPTSRQRNGL